MPELTARCPICAGELLVTRLRCLNCETELSGSFTAGKFLRLKSEQLSFVEVFVKNEGKIKDVEAELGISYPTVRARLREVILALGYQVGAEPGLTADRRREILEAIARKEITADEGARLLRGEARTRDGARTAGE